MKKVVVREEEVNFPNHRISSELKYYKVYESTGPIYCPLSSLVNIFTPIKEGWRVL